MDYQNILVTKEGAVAVVTLNRPKALNALNSELLRELVTALEGFDADDSVRAIVLTGSTLGLVGRGGNGSGGSDGYCASKHAIVGLGRTWAHWLAPHNIRVNSVHPAGANTPMVINDAVAKLFASAPASSGADEQTSPCNESWSSTEITGGGTFSSGVCAQEALAARPR